MLNSSDAIKKPEVIKISEIPLNYPQQWVSVNITKRDRYGWPYEGIVLLKSKDEDEIINSSQNLECEDLYFFYTGCIDD